MSIKSVHITNYYHKNSGGISTAYNQLLAAANRHRRPVRLIVPGPASEIEEVGEFGRIYYVKAGRSPLFDRRYRVMLPWRTYFLDSSPIKRILRDERPDIVEIGEKYTLSLMAGLLRKRIINISPDRPMLVHISCERMDDNMKSFVSEGYLLQWFCRRFVGNYLLPMFDFHLSNSAYTADEFFNSVCASNNPRRSRMLFNFCWRYLRAPKLPLRERVFVNPCGVDSETFSNARRDPAVRDRIMKEYGLPDDARILLYAGRLSPEKNTQLLPRMMKILAERSGARYSLIVAGSGPAAESLRSAAEKLPDGSMILAGQITDKRALADLYANCDAFVHPNPREPFGIAPLEAMAAGLPLLAPRSGGVLSYADDSNSWLTPSTPEDFATGAESLFSNDAVRAAKVSRALKTAEGFTWEASTDAMFAIYDEMYSQFTGSRGMFDYYDQPEEADFAQRLTTC